ncbi:MAG: relaxase MobL, partial [Oscillospiraceae bacterium]
MRFTDPRTKRRSTPQRNANHVQYIGEREHALIAEKEENHVRYIGERSHAALTEKQNGLFGKIRGEYSNSYDTADVQKYVREMSTTHRNIYWSVYSFTPESAAQAGLNSLKEWEDWVKLRTYEIAEHMKIRYDDLEYIAAVHLKEGQPHVHVGFWDKSQEIFRKTVSPVIADNIRIDAIKHTFREQFNALHNRENELITQMRDTTAQALSEENGAVLSKVQQMMNELKEKIPAKGRCAYQYMPQDIKMDLYNIMAELINNCEQLHALY